jgi:hypothetical protein
VPQSGVEVLLHGLPEKIDLLTAALDQAFPDLFEWVEAAPASDQTNIVLRGIIGHLSAEGMTLAA